MDSWLKLDEARQRQLTQEKIEARKLLLTMPPDLAQEISASVLHSSDWSVAQNHLSWDESLSLLDDDSDS